MKEKVGKIIELQKFGEKIKQIRKDAGMTQQEFADSLHISPKEVSYYECGKRFPKTETLILISKRYCVPIDDLLQFNENEKVRYRVDGNNIESISDPDELVRIIKNSIEDLLKKRK